MDGSPRSSLLMLIDAYRSYAETFEADNARLREQVVGHAERIAKQSELLIQRAEKPALAWTDKLPDKPGHYWWRGHKQAFHRDICYVSVSDGPFLKADFCQNLGMSRYVNQIGGDWYGPVESPK